MMLASWSEIALNEPACLMFGCVKLVLRDSSFGKKRSGSELSFYVSLGFCKIHPFFFGSSGYLTSLLHVSWYSGVIWRCLLITQFYEAWAWNLSDLTLNGIFFALFQNRCLWILKATYVFLTPPSFQCTAGKQISIWLAIFYVSNNQSQVVCCHSYSLCRWAIWKLWVGRHLYVNFTLSRTNFPSLLSTSAGIFLVMGNSPFLTADDLYM